MNSLSDWSRAAVHFVTARSDIEVAAELPLAAFQQHAARRLCDMANEWGGALLADGVGLGKTRVLLTAASSLLRTQRMTGINRPAWCVAPARTLPAWEEAARSSGLHELRLVSHTALARDQLPDGSPSVLLIDEAHRLRNRGTKRRQNLMPYLSAPTLLATATPVVNGLDDLRSLLELFLDDDDVRALTGWDLETAFALAGQGAWDVTELLRLVVVRRTEPHGADFDRRPTAKLEVVRYDPAPAEAWIWRHLEPQLRRLSDDVLGGDWPRGLFVEHVLRRWESGPDALVETLRQLRVFCERAVEARRLGRDLDRTSFRTLFGTAEPQEVFSFLYPEPTGEQRGDLRADLRVLRDLEKRATEAMDEGGRDGLIARLASEPEPLLVFTSYQRAAESLFRSLKQRLGPTAAVGLVTGRRAAATGLGTTDAHDVLRRFAPAAHGARHLRNQERVWVFVATDCIAEGVNLQDCGRVVLADLPYTPLGVEQRIGRLLRPGGPHAEVVVYLPRPTRWNDSLGMRRRLGAKVDAAHSAHVGPTNPLFDTAPNDRLSRLPPDPAPERSFDPSASGPLAALTGIDRLAAQVEAPGSRLEGAFTVEEPTHWLVAARAGAQRLPVLFVVDAAGGADHDLETATRILSDAVWSDDELQRVDLPEVVAQMIEERVRFLRAATAAPARLELHAPEVLAWNRLSTSPEVSDPSRFRARLVRPLRIGLRRRLEQLLDAECSLARLVRFVERLPEPSDGTCLFEYVSCVGVRATSSARASPGSRQT